jgi:hypothetical protein
VTGASAAALKGTTGEAVTMFGGRVCRELAGPRRVELGPAVMVGGLTGGRAVGLAGGATAGNPG